MSISWAGVFISSFAKEGTLRFGEWWNVGAFVIGYPD